MRTSAIASRFTIERLLPLNVSMLRPPSSVQLLALVWPPLNEKGTDVLDPNPGCCACCELTPGCRVINCVKLRVLSAISCTWLPKIVEPTFADAVSTCATAVARGSADRWPADRSERPRACA